MLLNVRTYLLATKKHLIKRASINKIDIWHEKPLLLDFYFV